MKRAWEVRIAAAIGLSCLPSAFRSTSTNVVSMTGWLLSSPLAPYSCSVPKPPPLLQVASASPVSTVSILRLARDPRLSVDGDGLIAIVSAESPRLLTAYTPGTSKGVPRVAGANRILRRLLLYCRRTTLGRGCPCTKKSSYFAEPRATSHLDCQRGRATARRRPFSLQSPPVTMSS